MISSSRTGQNAALAARIARFIDHSLAGAAPEPFDGLALDIHRWQRENDPVLAALCEGQAANWTEIPAVPVLLFKELDVGTVGADEARVCFRTSGTTGGGRGVHRMRGADLYDRGAVAWFDACVPDAPADVVALLHDPASAPDSSLSHMVGLFPTRGGRSGRASWHLHAGRVDRDGLTAALLAAKAPLFVAATAFALADWLDDALPALPAGSVLMVTGGFKGRRHRLDGEALYLEAARALRPSRVVTEYGMTELSSQLWGAPGSSYRPPPWLRVLAVEPETGAPLPPGAHGQLRFVDLCNLDGTLAVDTLDGGVVLTDGSVLLEGRLAGAEPRGCSLTVEEAWDAEDER